MKTFIFNLLLLSVYGYDYTHKEHIQQLLKQRTIQFELNENMTYNREDFNVVLSDKTKGSEDCQGEPNDFVHPKDGFFEEVPPTVIGTGSCWMDGSSSRQAIHRLVNDIKPDLQLWTGDQIYGDSEDVFEIKRKYTEKKNSCDFREFMQSNIPVMATVDDHDFGDDNEDRFYPQKEISQQLFVEHFNLPDDDPRSNKTLPIQKGFYSSELLGSKEKGRVHVIMLDVRYHHSPTFPRDAECDEVTTMLGDEQWKWLENELETIESEVVVLVSGLQVIPPTFRSDKDGKRGWSGYFPQTYCSYGQNGTSFREAIASMNETDITGGFAFAERWGEIPQDRERLFRLLQKSLNTGKTKEVVLNSGDVHFAELMEIVVPATDEYEAVAIREITASGFGQYNPFSFVGHPYRLAVVGYTTNFGSITIDWENSAIKLAIHTESDTDVATYTYNTFRPFGLS